jgi:hypothetical protein
VVVVVVVLVVVVVDDHVLSVPPDELVEALSELSVELEATRLVPLSSPLTEVDCDFEPLPSRVVDVVPVESSRFEPVMDAE